MLRQSKVINRHLNNQTDVPIALCMIALVVSYISLIDVAVAFTTFYSPEFELFFAVLNIFLSVSNIVIAFKMRNRLNSLLSAKRGDPTYFGGLGTFFFQALHFNFRVNQIYKLKFGQIN